ncbi:MAG: autotransporter-associated beta strand repeat-containing protein [Chthoniobacter sp.]
MRIPFFHRPAPLKKIVFRTFIPGLLTSTALVAFRLSAGAATYVWDKDPATAGAQDGAPGTWQVGVGNWFDSTNTVQNQTWADGNDAVFGSGTGAAGTVTLGGPITANSLTFHAVGSGAYIITGNTLTNTTGAITADVAATISSVLAGSSGLTKSGVGTLTLGGTSANTYTGVTTINAGELTLSKTAGVNAVLGDIQLGSTGKLTLGADNQIADTATLFVSGGTVNFSGKSETIRNLTMSGGTFGTGNTGSITSTVTITDTLALSGGAMTLNSGVTMSAGTVTMTGSNIGASSGGNILIGGALMTKLVVGSGGLSMTGQTIVMNAGAAGNQIVLNGDVTASGTNNIVTGTGTAGVGTINEVAIGSANRTLNITGGTTNINVVITGSGGSLIKTGAGALTFGGSVANTYSGLVTVSAGTLTLKKTGVNAIAGDVLVNGGTLSLGANDQIADTSNVTVSSGTFTGMSGTANFNETFGNLLLNGGTFTSGSGIFNIGNVNVTGGGGSSLTVNSGGTVNVAGISLTGGGILLGGSATNLTTLTIGAGGLSLTGQVIQINAAAAGDAGTQIFLNGDLTASGTNNFTVSGAEPDGAVAQLVIGSATRNFNITNGSTVISPAIVGAGGSLVKQGIGQLALLGDNTYTGTTTVLGGSLAISATVGTTQGKLSGTTALTVTGGGNFQDGSSTANLNDSVSDRVNPAAGLTLGGSTGGGAFVQAFGTVSSSQTLASLAIRQGGDTITTVNTAAGTLSLAFTGTVAGGGYSRSVGGALNVVSGNGYTVSFANAPTAAGGSSVSGTGADAILIGATLNGTDFIAAQAGALTAATYTNTGTATWTAGKNMNVTGNVTASSSTEINSLRFGTAGAFTVSLMGVQVVDNGILVNSAVGANLSRITGGTLTGSAGGDLLIFQYNNDPNGGLTIGSTIADNGSATALTVDGTGVVTLTAANTYTGLTYLDGGTLSIGSNAALGDQVTDAAVHMDGGTLLANASFALEQNATNRRGLVLDGFGGTLGANTGLTLTINSDITGVGMLTSAGSGAVLLTGANTYSGGTTLSSGTLQLGSDGALSTGTVVVAGGGLQAVGAARSLSNPFSLKSTGSVTGSLDLAITGTSTITGSGFTWVNNLASGHTLTIGGSVFLSTGAVSTAHQLTFSGAGATVISGVISDNDIGKTLVGGVTLNGTGTLKLTGLNTYTGRTITAGGGSLIVQQDANFGAAPTIPMTDAIILAQQGFLRIETGFTLNSNRGIGIGATTGGVNTGSIEVLSGQTFTVAGAVADRTVNAGGDLVTGVNIGSLAKIGAGKLVLAGQNTYSGNTTVSAGTLEVSGTIAALTAGSQAVSVATGATLQLDGAGAISASTLSLGNNSTLSLEVGALTSNTISLTGAATLTGTIALALNLTADPTDGTLFTLIDGGSAVAGYAGGARFFADGQALDEGATFNVSTGGFTQEFQISYTGGSDGDDVVIRSVPEPSVLISLSASLGLMLGVTRFRRARLRLANPL